MSLVLSIITLCGVGSIVGIILGFVARNQIKVTGQQGDGLAKAGIIVGFVTLALTIIWVIMRVAFAATYGY